MDLTNLLKKSGPKIERSTLLRYSTTIGRLYKGMTDKEWNGSLDFLKDVNSVEKYIYGKNYKLGTTVDYFKSVNSFLKRLKGFEPLSKAYANLQGINKDLYDNEKGTNRLTERESKNWMDWKSVVQFDDFDTDEDQLLHALYTSIPPRRQEYKYLKFIKGKTKKQIGELTKDFNYLIVNKKGTPTEIILHRYKTVKRYGTFRIDLTEKNQLPIFQFSHLRDAVKHFANSSGIKSGDLVFPTSTGTVYSTFTHRINYLFRKTGKKVSSNLLRHSFASYWLDRKLTTNTMKLLAKYLGHSVETLSSYRKFTDSEESFEND